MIWQILCHSFFPFSSFPAYRQQRGEGKKHSKERSRYAHTHSSHLAYPKGKRRRASGNRNLPSSSFPGSKQGGRGEWRAYLIWACETPSRCTGEERKATGWDLTKYSNSSYRKRHICLQCDCQAFATFWRWNSIRVFYWRIRHPRWFPPVCRHEWCERAALLSTRISLSLSKKRRGRDSWALRSAIRWWLENNGIIPIGKKSNKVWNFLNLRTALHSSCECEYECLKRLKKNYGSFAEWEKPSIFRFHFSPFPIHSPLPPPSIILCCHRPLNDSISHTTKDTRKEKKEGKKRDVLHKSFFPSTAVLFNSQSHAAPESVVTSYHPFLDSDRDFMTR